MILTVTLNPSIDRTVFVDALQVGDTNRVGRSETDAGGKGLNLSRVAAELGGHTVALGFLGGGPGAYIRCVLNDQGVEYDFVEIAGETRMNVSIEEGNGSPPTTLNERGPEITSQHWDELLQKCTLWAPKAAWACMGGSIPPGLGKDAYRTLGGLLKEAGCKLALDADGEAMKLGLEAGPQFIKPNAHEAERLLGRPMDSVEACVDGAKELHGRGIDFVVISRGADGAVLACSEGVFVAESPKVKAVSTIGSGDSLVAGFLWGLESGKSVEEAFRWGVACGAATATTSGAEIARKPVILELEPRVTISRTE
ncbi:MAG: 1-phosphofructokinase [Fimbriimonadaceae bacterium]|nr:1-phosphofructokinase [Fimbriimonadaceae bacterium]